MKKISKEEMIQGLVETGIRLGTYGATVLLGKIALNKIQANELAKNEEINNLKYANNLLKLNNVEHDIELKKNSKR